MSRQRTLTRTLTTATGEQIRVVARASTYMGNANGFSVRVDGKKYHLFCLTIEEAVKRALELHTDKKGG